MEESPAIDTMTSAVNKNKIFKKPMHVAVIEEDIKTILSLKKSGVKINDVENGETPLHLAVILGKTLAVKKLISLGANLSEMNKGGFTALHLAVINNSVSLLKYLIDQDTEGDVDTFDRNGFTALQIAVLLGKVDAVRELLLEGADADLPNKEGTAPLHFAVIQGDSDVLDVLLEYVEKPNILNKNELRPLHLAVMYNQIDAVRKIGELNNTDVNYLNGNGNSPLHLAITLGNLGAVQELLDLGADANLRNSKCHRPIHLAVIYNRPDAIEPLKQCGALLNYPDRLRNTPLHLAVTQNNIPALRILLDLGASVNLRNAYGNSPLLTAIMAGNICATRLLLQFGADINVVNAKDMTPLHIAICLGNQEIITFLFLYGLSVYTRDAFGNAPIHSAAKFCNSSGIKTIIQYGAMPSSVNRDGLTALDIILQYVRKDTFKSAVKTLNDFYKKRKLPLDAHEILKSAKEIFKYEILSNFKNSKLKEPEYISNVAPILRSYISDCIAEVRLMKSNFLHANFSFHSLALYGWNYTKPIDKEYNSDVALNHILDVSTTKGYPIYRGNFACKLRRSSLLKKIAVLRMHARHGGRTILLDPDAIPLIIEHLSNDDILNLLLAYSDLDPVVSKRKFDESQLDFSTSIEKSNQISGTKKLRRSELQKSTKKPQSNSSNGVSTSSIITRSMKASDSKTGSGKKVQVIDPKSSFKTKKNCHSVLKKSRETKRASLRTKSTKRNDSLLSNQVTRRK